MNSEIVNKALNACYANFGDPKVIIMHPDTFREFMTTLSSEFVGIDFASIKHPKYSGIKIYRSEDVNENQVEVY
jgi:C-terminal processing protease CtpA/Prc